MPQKHNPGELDFSDWTDWVANGLTAIVLGGIIGALFGWQFERAGIFWGCVIWILVFTIIGFRKQIRYFIRFLYQLAFNKRQSKKGDQE